MTSNIPVFPKAYWSPWDSDVEFIPGEELPSESVGRIYAVIVHAFFGEQVLMAQIVGRGVCVPSGRLTPGETIDAAAVRETFEETGAHLDPLQRRLIGCYRMVRRGRTNEIVQKEASVFYSACFVAEVTHFDPIPADSESAGFLYCRWRMSKITILCGMLCSRLRLHSPGTNDAGSFLLELKCSTTIDFRVPPHFD